MTDLRELLFRLGLEQYIERFTDEGFDTWETVLDITESDLDALGVKLGHRRKLQREIAVARGVSIGQLNALNSPTQSHSTLDSRNNVGGEFKEESGNGAGTRTKRKYRRHPKVDENAPERPPSAYVIFSNKIREELKSLNLSFTDIAKRVGEKWQVLLTEEKEPYETQATSAKERFHTEMAAYKMTDTFVEYSDYLTDFKTKNALQADGKRPRLEQELSNASSTSVGSGTNNADSTLINADARHRGRVDSMSSTGQYSTPGSLPSPASVNSRPAAPRGSVGAILPNGAASPMSTSPSSPSVYRDSSAGPLFSHAQPSIEYPERLTAYNSLQQLPRILPSKSHEHQNSSSSTTPIDPRLSHSRTSPYSSSHHAPSLVHHTSSHSSNPSVNSNQSGTSTAASSNPSLNSNQSSVSNAASSLFKQGGDEDSKPQMTLPPLAAVSMKSSGTSSPAEHALRPSRASQSGLTSSGLVAQQNSDSPFGSFAPSGMEFESLQLSLPYNISFGRQPLPRPDNDGKLANICDLQDVSRERHSLRGLSLQQTGTSPRETLGSSRSPSDRPVLPSISQVSCIARHGTPDPNEQPKPDPLSVLADAANDADRKSRPSRPST